MLAEKSAIIDQQEFVQAHLGALTDILKKCFFGFASICKELKSKQGPIFLR